MPTAAATTHSVNSSREPVRATCHSSHGNSAPAHHQHQRDERRHLRQRDAAAWSTGSPPACRRAGVAAQRRRPARGSSTSTSTITRSSTTSQPTAMRPLHRVERRRGSSSARSSTTVLATDSARPNTRPPPRPSPTARASARAQRGGHGDLHDRAGQRDPAHRQQVVEREVQARRRTSAASRRSRRAAPASVDVGHEARRGRARSTMPASR